MTGGQAIIEQLVRCGVDTVFGLPGVQTYALLDALHGRSDVRFVGARHEQGAAYMALGYAQSTGRPAAYSVVPGPGVLNTTAALATALATNAPVVCVAGQVANASLGRGRGDLHELPDQLGLLRGLTRHAVQVRRPADAPGAVAEAIARATSGRPGPVAIEVTWDAMTDEGDIELVSPHVPAAPPVADARAVTRAADLLASARRPMIWVGSGAIGARDEIEKLAELLGAPVACWRGGRGIVDDDHPLAAHVATAWHLWESCDVALAIGTRAELPYLRWPPREAPPRLVRVDIDPAELDRLPAEVAMLADAAQAAGALLAELGQRMPGHRADTSHVTDARRKAAEETSRIQPQADFLAAMREVIPPNGFLVEDMCQAGYTAWFGFPIHEPRTFVRTGYMGNLGFGYATALGVKVAHPKRAVVSLAGDGGFLFNAQELATAAHEGIGVVTVVFDNGGWENVRRDQLAQFGRATGADLTSPDFVKLAQSFGVAASRAETPAALQAALDRALGKDVPALIHVPIAKDSEASPWPLVLRRALR